MKPLIALFLVTLACLNAEPYEWTQLGDSIERATLKVLKEAYHESKDKNVITSPLGVFLLLSMYSAGASPAGRQEIDDFLGGGDHKQLTESYISLTNEFAQIDPSSLSLANKIYATDRYELVGAFADALRAYGNEIEKIDFSDVQGAADAINAWAAEKTQGHITSPVAASDLDPVTTIALLNAIFFEGEWDVPFEEGKTKDKDFYVAKNTIIKKPTMTLEDWIPYAKSEELGASLLELGYKEKGFRAIIVIPDEIDGLPSVLERSERSGLLKNAFELQQQYIHLHFPKFEIRSKLDFKKILEQVGVSKIFYETTSEILEQPISVSKILQEALVKFDEKGATATAFSAMFGLLRSSPIKPPSIDIRVDHPFLFYILYEDKVLFAGTYSG